MLELTLHVIKLTFQIFLILLQSVIVCSFSSIAHNYTNIFPLSFTRYYLIITWNNIVKLLFITQITEILMFPYLALALLSWSIWSAISLDISCCFLRRAATCASPAKVCSSRSRRSFNNSCSLFLLRSIWKRRNYGVKYKRVPLADRTPCLETSDVSTDLSCCCTTSLIQTLA